jgi:hypothetical protein
LCLPLLIGVPVTAQDDEIAISDSINFGDNTWRARAESLFWWTRGNAIPALITTSPDETSRTDAGVLGTRGVDVLFGNDTIDDQMRAGARLTLARWLDADDTWGLEAVLVYVGDDNRSGNYAAESPGFPILARPFFNIQRSAEDSELVAYPNVLQGRVSVDSSSEVYSGAILARHNVGLGPLGRIDLLGGYRYFRLQETLRARENLTSIDPGGLVPRDTTFDLSDRFATENDFHGGEIGISAQFDRDFVSLEVLAKVALGNLRRQTHVEGQTTVTVPGLPPQVAPGGLLAVPTNIGSYADNDFAVLPEFGFTGTVLLTRRLSFVCGYSLMFLNNVARTGDQIDRIVNPSQIGGRPLVGPARPQFSFAGSDFWTQGLNFGLDYRW